jgi:hypothetical protein
VTGGGGRSGAVAASNPMGMSYDIVLLDISPDATEGELNDVLTVDDSQSERLDELKKLGSHMVKQGFQRTGGEPHAAEFSNGPLKVTICHEKAIFSIPLEEDDEQAKAMFDKAWAVLVDMVKVTGFQAFTRHFGIFKVETAYGDVLRHYHRPKSGSLKDRLGKLFKRG